MQSARRGDTARLRWKACASTGDASCRESWPVVSGKNGTRKRAPGGALRALQLAALVGLVCSACAGGQRLSSVEVDTARVVDRVALLERNQQHLRASVDSLDRLVRAQTQAVGEERAGRQTRVDELERQLGALQADLHVAEQEIAELKDRIAFGPGGQSQPTAAAPESPPASGSESSPREIYDAAYEDLMRGNYGLATMGFQEVLELYPTSQLADNALYWLGETHYVQKDYESALEYFLKVRRDYPGTDKEPAAILKASYCQLELGRKADARASLEELVASFPTSDEARLARDKLRSF